MLQWSREKKSKSQRRCLSPECLYPARRSIVWQRDGVARYQRLFCITAQPRVKNCQQQLVKNAREEVGAGNLLGRLHRRLSQQLNILPALNIPQTWCQNCMSFCPRKPKCTSSAGSSGWSNSCKCVTMMACVVCFLLAHLKSSPGRCAKCISCIMQAFSLSTTATIDQNVSCDEPHAPFRTNRFLFFKTRNM